MRYLNYIIVSVTGGYNKCILILTIPTDEQILQYKEVDNINYNYYVNIHYNNTHFTHKTIMFVWE